MNNVNIINENAVKEKYLRLNKVKLQAAKIAAILMIITALIFAWVFSDAPVKKWVYDNYDKNGILSDDTVKYINDKNSVLFSEKEKEIVVVIEKENGENKNLTKRAEKLFRDYNVSSDGILFIISVPEKTSSSKNFFDSIVDWASNLGGAIEHRAFCTGKNAVGLDDKIDGILEKYLNGSENYTAASKDYYNAAVINIFNELLAEFDNRADNTNIIDTTDNDKTPATENDQYPTKYPR